MKIEDICENYEIEDSDRQFQYIEKTKNIRYRFRKKLPKKYNKVIFEEKNEPNLKKKNLKE